MNENAMSDIWERHFNCGALFPPSFLPGDDQDGDGWTNLTESTAGTDPTNPRDHPKNDIRHIPAVWYSGPEEQEPVLLSPEAYEISAPTVMGKSYKALYSENLVEWTDASEAFPGFGTNQSIYQIPQYEDGSPVPKGFWRLGISDTDTDGDSISDAGEWLAGTNPNNPETFTGLPDAWIIQHFATGIGFDPLADPDGDGLSNFEEYLHGTSPVDSDTDGDGTNDGDEAAHGGDPADDADGGNPPEDPLVEVPFSVGGDFATWRMEIKGLGPRDARILRLTSPNPGATETRAFKLRKNNRYQITLHRTGGVDGWYCWEAAVDGLPGSEAFEQTGEWQVGDRLEGGHFLAVGEHWLVDNRQGLLTSHIDSHETNVAGGLRAELVPVAIEDNIVATGVDDVSITSTDEELRGYQDKYWIMAPIAGPPPPADYSNLMKFDIPLSPPATCLIDCENAEADPDSITLDNSKPEVLWRGAGDNETSDNTPVFKIGGHEDEVELPVRVKTMKHRVVKLTVFPVRDPQNTRPVVPMPTPAQLQTKLDETFGYQLNAWFVVDYKPQQTYDYDPDNDGYVVSDSDEFKQMYASPDFSDESADIRLLLVDGIHIRNSPEDFPKDIQHEIYGWAKLDERLAVANAGNPTEGIYTAQAMVDTIAHEIGHVMLGAGHPDEYYLEPFFAGEHGGRAPLPGTDTTIRLMCGRDTRKSGARLLVKAEWDRAEQWLKGRPNGDN